MLLALILLTSFTQSKITVFIPNFYLSNKLIYFFDYLIREKQIIFKSSKPIYYCLSTSFAVIMFSSSSIFINKEQDKTFEIFGIDKRSLEMFDGTFINYPVAKYLFTLP